MIDLVWGLLLAVLIFVWLGAEFVGFMAAPVRDRANERVQLRAYYARAGSVIGMVIVVGLLAGCASTQAVQERIVEVKVPVAVQPIKASDIPPAPPSLGPRPPTLRQAADKALAGWCMAVAYIVKADPLLRISAGGKPAQLPNYPECEGR